MWHDINKCIFNGQLNRVPVRYARGADGVTAHGCFDYYNECEILINPLRKGRNQEHTISVLIVSTFINMYMYVCIQMISILFSFITFSTKWCTSSNINLVSNNIWEFHTDHYFGKKLKKSIKCWNVCGQISF